MQSHQTQGQALAEPGRIQACFQTDSACTSEKGLDNMKIMIAITMAGTIGVSTWAAQPSRAEEHKVSVCIEHTPAAHYLPRAELIASKMFAPIGVKLVWRLQHSCPAGDTIQVRISVKTPANEFPGVLARALPYEGVHIVVFYDRINHSAGGDVCALVLAHVLVHEITHVLESIDRHSESGVMKAHWTDADYARMRAKPLPFTGWDIQLIHKGLESRGVRLAERNVTAEIPSSEQLSIAFP
jgi:hypothetical protein